MFHDLLTERESSPFLRVTIKTLQAWRQLRKGPRFVKVGRRVFYPRVELEKFLSDNLVETAVSGRAE